MNENLVIIIFILVLKIMSNKWAPSFCKFSATSSTFSNEQSARGLPVRKLLI